MKGYRLQGSGVGLNANAQRALEAINPELLARQVHLRVHLYAGVAARDSKLMLICSG
jgi:hypothetical protein